MSSSTAKSDEDNFFQLSDRNIQWRRCVLEQPDSCFAITEWNKFAKACGLSIAQENRERSFRLLRDVFTSSYASRVMFDKKLFEALQEIIGTDQIELIGSNGNAFALKNKGRIGFTRQIHREGLSSEDKNASSDDSRSDHSCVIFTNVTSQDYEPQETTAVVELVFDEGNCASFETTTTNEILLEPTPDSGHGPVAQVVLNGLDIWHCFARCGVQPEKVHALILGGRSDNQLFSDKSCCVDVTVNVPKRCSDTFYFNINLVLQFDQVSYDEFAIAAYLRAMRLGLQHASKIVSLTSLIPVSLCCRQLSFGGQELRGAQLVATPIPRASTLSNGINVHQGELFRWRPPHPGWFATKGVVFDTSTITNTTLIKVCCTAVHNSQIPPKDWYSALMKLYVSRNTLLLGELSKGLIAYVAESRSTHVLVLHDLSAKQDNLVDIDRRDSKRLKAKASACFKPLQPSKFQGKMSLLWTGFSQLVTKVLLPMADERVVHAGICPGWMTTHKILCRTAESGVELRLIDFGSISTLPLPSFRDGRCIHDMYSTSMESAHQFLWWQVMHVAYVWSEQLHNDDPKSMLADNFMNCLFESKELEPFLTFLGWQNIELPVEGVGYVDKNSFENLLYVIGAAF